MPCSQLSASGINLTKGCSTAHRYPFYHRLESRIGLRTVRFHPFNEHIADRLQVVPGVRILTEFAVRGQHLPQPLPDEEHFAVGLEKEVLVQDPGGDEGRDHLDRKSTRLNSSHL